MFFMKKDNVNQFNKASLRWSLDKIEQGISYTKHKFAGISSVSLEWTTIILLHCASIPSILSLLLGVVDHMPDIDIILFLWVGLFVYFIKSFLENNRIVLFTNATGFFIQAMLLAMVVFQ
jgi:hypothetical protein